MFQESIYPHEPQVSFQCHILGMVVMLTNGSISEAVQVGMMFRKINVDMFPSS